MGTDELGRDVFLRLLLAGRLSLAIAFTVASLAFNYIGDGLRDALDPRLKL